MERLALIVKGYSKSKEEEQSDILFVKLYYQFLNSIAGGAWEEDEIVFLDEPEMSEYVEVIHSTKPSYAVTILIGHGATIMDHQLFLLNESTIVKPGQFILETDKQLIILESCRSNLDEISWVDLENKIPKYPYGGYIRGYIDWETSKQLYMTHLNQCELGIVICFACSKSQSAYNYFFSNELIQFSQNLFLDTLYYHRTFGILNIMPYIIKRVNRKSRKICRKEQIPEVYGNINFPFALSRFDLLDFEKKDNNEQD